MTTLMKEDRVEKNGIVSKDSENFLIPHLNIVAEDLTAIKDVIIRHGS